MHLSGSVATSLISKLPKAERKELLDNLNYLNMAEIKSFCKRHSIPYVITAETPDGKRIKTKDEDRKGVVLHRIRHFLLTGILEEETCFCAAVVCFDPLPEDLTAGDRLFYPQYDKTNQAMVALLKDLTGGHFKDGAIARILAREFWSQGKAPTFQEFAAAWLQAINRHMRPNPEWAFLSDRASGAATSDWKKLRASKATRVMKTLNRIAAG